MDTSIIVYLSLALIVLFIFHKYMKQSPNKKTNKTDTFQGNISTLYKAEPLIAPPLNDNWAPAVPPSPIIDTIGEFTMYKEVKPYCDKPMQTHDEYHKDFFGFRDRFTNENTSINYDPVDAVNNVTLTGEYEGAKIKDIYDNMTKGTNIYMKN